MITKKTTLLVFLAVLAAFPVSAEPIKCAECGMMSDLESKFTSRIMDGDKMLCFCDICDLLVYLNKHQQQVGKFEVKDYTSGEWIDSKTAKYVAAPRKFSSPMGWGIAAFKDKNNAAMNGKVLDFDARLRAVK